MRWSVLGEGSGTIGLVVCPVDGAGVPFSNDIFGSIGVVSYFLADILRVIAKIHC